MRMSDITIETDEGSCVWRLSLTDTLTMTPRTCEVLNAMNEYINRGLGTQPVGPLYDTLSQAFYDSLDGE